MPKIVKETIEKIKLESPIAEVAKEIFPDLKRVGESYKARSPITGEKTASLTIFPKTNTFVDYSAGGDYKGDVIKLVMLYKQMNFLDAVTFLSEAYNIPLYKERGPNLSAEVKEIRADRYHEILEWATREFEKNLWDTEGGSVALDYLVAKGFSEETLKFFRVGFAFDSYNVLLKAGHERGYSNEELFNVGLINTSHDKEGKKRNYDTFRHRIMFPFVNEAGLVCGYTARLLPGSKTNFVDAPKYTNTKGTKVFDKGSLLFGIKSAREAIRSQKLAIIMEGPTDVMAMWQGGFKNVVAGCGTAFTEKHLQLLSRYSPNFLTLYDGDSAGKKATTAVIDILLTGGGEVDVALVPDGLDPQELIMMRGVGAMEEVISSKVNFIDYRAGEIQASEASPVRKATAMKQVVRTICFISDTALRYTYLERCARITGIDIERLKEMEQKHLDDYKKKQQELLERMRKARFELTEDRELLRLILRNSRVQITKFLNFTDFVIQTIVESDFYFNETEDRYLYNEICAMRLRDADIGLENLSQTDSRAYMQAGKIIGFEKYSPVELKLKPRKSQALAEVMAICVSRLIESQVNKFKIALNSEDEEEEREKLKRRVKTFESIQRENNSLIKSQAIL